ncbi:DegV family protein with EDD domain [Weissella uvarum]|uniref:DegV family protein n=1 Tax=Weissella uvarum TaxID=1479233 RepID=UPI00196157B7|nr:DegV family protein [Weissella uvarum]MBM7617565.1 DegV family protein with EDD domain [Weissella uvarum]MCM0595553.1 DegV family protein [Weissella uvarum]
MAQVKIVTDSTALISPEEAEKYDITIIPLTVMVDGTVYQDGVTIGRDEFVQKMADAENLPTTSQPALGVFTEAYEKLANEGATSIISIHLTSGLSGTVDAAKQAAMMVNADVTVIDSDFIDRSEAFQVLAAAEAAQAGASKEEVLQKVQETHDKTDLYLTVAELDNLVKGGRLSKTAGFVAGLMNIQVGAHVVKGDIEVEVKGRGSKAIRKYIDSIIEKMKQAPNGVKRVDIAHVGIPEKTQALSDEIKEIFPDAEYHIYETSPTVATHTGPNAMGISIEYN